MRNERHAEYLIGYLTHLLTEAKRMGVPQLHSIQSQLTVVQHIVANENGRYTPDGLDEFARTHQQWLFSTNYNYSEMAKRPEIGSYDAFVRRAKLRALADV